LSAVFNRYAEGIYSLSPEPEPISQPHVALLVDYPVLLRAIRATDPDAVARLGDVVRRARTLGSVFVSRAYGAWYDVDEATAAFSEGLDPVYVPPAGPGNVPTTSALVADGLALLTTGQIQALALSGAEFQSSRWLRGVSAGVVRCVGGHFVDFRGRHRVECAARAEDDHSVSRGNGAFDRDPLTGAQDEGTGKNQQRGEVHVSLRNTCILR